MDQIEKTCQEFWEFSVTASNEIVSNLRENAIDLFIFGEWQKKYHFYLL